MIYRKQFTVVGRVPFPLDMLRYDSCSPDTEEAARAIRSSIVAEINGHPELVFAVALVRITQEKNWQPTRARWTSFGWEVQS